MNRRLATSLRGFVDCTDASAPAKLFRALALPASFLYSLVIRTRNLLYDLNACKAFNDGLVKGIAKEHLESPEGGDEMVRLISAEARQSARFQRIAKGKAAKTVEVKQGDSLGIVHEAFEGIEVTEIAPRFVCDKTNGNYSFPILLQNPIFDKNRFKSLLVNRLKTFILTIKIKTRR